ncbi:MAG TPA: L-threonylcarbamoyladenylate synthase [Myxococcales bacterium]|nr:L-threonylcarbamoyladenylate synthase [Myxococcales bacterium]
MAGPIIEVDPEHPNPRTLDRAVEALREGGLVAYPTDTYYGVGCDLLSKKAIMKLYELKGRDRRKPLAFLCPDLSEVARYAHVNNFAYRTLKQLTPGPFTFVLDATRIVPEMMMTKQKQVGIRVPASAIALELPRLLGRPVVTTSATDREGNPLVDARDIKEELGHGLDLILDGGIHPSDPSTVVRVHEDRLEILRQGKGVL